MREYDCRFCLSQGMDKKRDCMATWINPNASSEIWLSPPVIDENQKVSRDKRGAIEQNTVRVREEEFLDLLWDFAEKITSKSSFEVYLLFFDEVCLTALADGVMFKLIEVEATVAEYKGAIGNMDEEDVRFGLLGFHMEYEDLLEAFNIVRCSKMDYERYRYEKNQQENESK